MIQFIIGAFVGAVVCFAVMAMIFAAEDEHEKRR